MYKSLIDYLQFFSFIILVRSDLLLAADSLTSAMSSLVHQLNTGKTKRFFLSFNRISHSDVPDNHFSVIKPNSNFHWTDEELFFTSDDDDDEEDDQRALNTFSNHREQKFLI